MYDDGLASFLWMLLDKIDMEHKAIRDESSGSMVVGGLYILQIKTEAANFWLDVN
jgi:hypothetical protein